MSDARRWRQVKDVLEAALARPPEALRAFLDTACGDDASLRAEVESLLAAQGEAGDFLSLPASLTTAAGLEGTRVGPYRVLGQIGHGGMGIVYRAVRDDDAFRRVVALKVVYSGGPALLERRLREERQILARLQHPNIATIFDGGATDEGRPYFVMEYVEGRPITEYCDAAGLDTRRRLETFRSVCDAVHHAHLNLVVHRDLKPANILVSADGSPKLLDFGIAKLLEGVDALTAPTATMTPAMTPEYASPELVRGEAVTAASDVYSLGVVLYELLIGRRPYEVPGNSLEAIVRVVCDTDPRPPSAVARREARARTEPVRSSPSELRGDLDTIVLKALRKEPRHRYGSVEELSEDVRRHLDGFPIRARRDGVAYRSSKFVRRNRAAVVSAALSAATLLAIALGGVFERHPPPLAPAAIESLAVLPLVSANADPETEYLSQGITEGVIDSLSRLPRLKVMARSTVFGYKSAGASPREVGRQLGVRAVLAGRVVHQGGRFTIEVELVDVRDGARLWGEQYTPLLTGLPGVQEDITREIAAKVHPRLAGEDKERLTRRYTDDAAAYELYLRGRYFWNKRTPEDLQRAITYFQEAIEKDPHYALAHAGLADSYNVLAVLSEVPAEGAYARAKAAALEALRLDDGLAEAHTSLASVQLRHDWDWGGAEREFRRAIELNPSYPTAHYWYGLYLAEVGRPEEAVAEVRRAQEVDPLSLNTSYHVGVVLYYVRRYDEAIEQLRSTLELEPGFVQGHRYLALACEQKRLYAEATAELQRAVALGGRSGLLQSLLGHVDAVAGRKDQARKVARALRAQPGTAPYHLAVLYAGLGEKEEALRWLEKAYAERSSWLTVLRADPRLDGLRADPRFEDLMRRVGLTPTSGPP